MTRFLACATLVVSALTVASARQQAPVFRAGSETVRVFVTVTDKSERLVTGLVRGEFEALDNGKVQPITLFDNTPQAVRLIIMLDVSGSMSGNLPLLRAATQQLFTKLRPDDLVRVGTFGGNIYISPKFTNNPEELEAALPTHIPPMGGTPLWKSLDQAMTELKAVDERRVILVLSDGKDTGMMGKFGEKYVGQLDVVDRANREDVMIYAVGLRSRQAMRGMPPPGGLGAMLAEDFPDPGLGKVALDTGGGYFELRPRDDMATTFARVADELHSQYLMGYAPPAHDGKQHKIEVRMKNRELKPRARKNYVAPKDMK